MIRAQVHFKLDKEHRKSSIQWKTTNPRWVGEHLDWFEVPADSRLEVKVMDYDRWSADEVCGYLEVDISEEVAKARM